MQNRKRNITSSFTTIRMIGMGAIIFILLAATATPLLIVSKISNYNQRVDEELDELFVAININNDFEVARENFQELLEGDEIQAKLIPKSMEKVIEHANKLVTNAENEEEKEQAREFIVAAKRFKTASLNFIAEYKYDPYGDNAMAMKKFALDTKREVSLSLFSFMKDVLGDIKSAKNSQLDML